MNDDNYIGTSPTNSTVIPYDKLQAPGVATSLVVLANFADGRYDGKDRVGDTTPRSFEVRARFSKHPVEYSEIHADCSAEIGSSYFRLPPGVDQLEAGVAVGTTIVLEGNSRGEIASANFTTIARTALEARVMFDSAISHFCDRLSYIHAVPVIIGVVAVRDVSNEVQYTYLQSPPRPSALTDSSETFHEEMRPVYALYREFQNSSSAYYRLLCLYKIMEGLLGTMRASVQLRATEMGRVLDTPKATVPDHADIDPRLREHVGTPINSFFNNYLRTEHRNAIAHFEMDSAAPLVVSSIPDATRFAAAAFLADLCVRILIQRHEASLAQLS